MMLKFTPEMLHQLADDIERNKKYCNKCGYVKLTVTEKPNGKHTAQFEQPSVYAECFSAYYKYEEE